MVRRVKSRRRDRSRKSKLGRNKGKSKRRYNKSKKRSSRTAGVFDMPSSSEIHRFTEKNREHLRKNMNMGKGKSDYNMLRKSHKNLTEKLMNSNEHFVKLGTPVQRHKKTPKTSKMSKTLVPAAILGVSLI